MKEYNKRSATVNENKAPLKPTFTCSCGFVTGDVRKMKNHQKACKN